MEAASVLLAQTNGETWGVGPNAFWSPSPICVAITVAWILGLGWFVFRKWRLS